VVARATLRPPLHRFLAVVETRCLSAKLGHRSSTLEGSMRTPLVASAFVCVSALGGCATDWSSYPWADASEMCRVELLEPGRRLRQLPSFPTARGTVITTGGEPLPGGLHYVVRFADGQGSQTITSRDPDFSLCIEKPSALGYYQWFAEVRETPAGAVLYRSPAPQPFEARKPIVVLVDRTS